MIFELAKFVFIKIKQYVIKEKTSSSTATAD
jgi:hypothetical protein